MTKDLLSTKYLSGIYNKLVRAWNVEFPKSKEKIRHYQKINKRFKNALDVMRDISEKYPFGIVDIGCNNGILSVVASMKFDKVIGVEFNETFYRNALITKTFFKKRGFDTTRIFFRNEKLNGFKNNDLYNIKGILACQVLYHLDNKDIDVLLDIMEDAEIFICSARKDKNKTNNRFGLYTVKSISKFLKQNGFDIDKIYHKKTNWPIFVATKR